MLAEPLAIISYDKRELYAVRVKDIIIDNERNSIEFQSPEYINSNGDIVRDRHYMKMEKSRDHAFIARSLYFY